MKTNSRSLLPSVCKPIGWILFAIALVLFVLLWNDCLDGVGQCQVLSVIPNMITETSTSPDGHVHTSTSFLFLTQNDTWTDEIAYICGMLGLFFIAFAAEKEEDECTLQLRQQACFWAFKWDVILFSVLTLTVFDLSFLIILELQPAFVFLLFIARFQWQLHRFRKENEPKEEGEQL